MRKISLLLTITAGVLLTACAAKPPIVAQNKTVVVNDQTFVLGGSYDKANNKLLLTANGDPIMQGRFPPMTPTQNLNANFKDMKFKGDCYFGSVLGDQGGSFGIVASIVQSAKSSTADKCDIFIDGTKQETLYF
ncbi:MULTISPECIES: hypothetical protein [unclassified Shewanella]|jgi:hypothetical protein|uniref:hypothetical protein n=1 Tax=Shewanella TaxID=22 RepID=UPI000C3257F8|nr:MULTISPECIES: hypothetical protein [unclassified Shewanella]MBB1362388.1 hypothetical protein [Shewanella sp. SR44-4]MBO1896560.1 hypothetical protein [Shewanella sp. BF02_Schw]PKH29539.1 hypothetical protein CXF88_16425 [Shewanella sp. ALD9]QHS15096.1 hypothetical protein GUY17_19305 [Shewanella sp. Arc9-LZ]